jgi:hypothetical protein
VHDLADAVVREHRRHVRGVADVALGEPEPRPAQERVDVAALERRVVEGIEVVESDDVESVGG